MQTDPPAPGGWTVGSVISRIQANAAGQLVPGYTVHFSTSKGVAGSVWVPESELGTPTAKELIAAKAAQLDAIAELSG